MDSNWILVCAFLVGVLLILLIIGVTVCVGKSFGLCKKLRSRRVCSPAYERDHLSVSHVENEEAKNSHGRRLFRYKRPKFAKKLNKNQVYWLANSDDHEPIATICSKSEYQTPRTIRVHDVSDQDCLIVPSNDNENSNHPPVKKQLNFDKTSLCSTLNASPSSSVNNNDDVVIKQKKLFGSNRWSLHSFQSASINSYASSVTPVRGGGGQEQLLLEHDDADSNDQQVSQSTAPVEGSLRSLNFQKVKDAIDNIIHENIDKTEATPNERDSILNLNYPYTYSRQTDPANISVSDAYLKAHSDKRVQDIRDKRTRSIFSKAAAVDHELVHF